MMTSETEFKLLLHQKLCDLADLFLYQFDPCKLTKNGQACLLGDPNPCCTRTRFKREDGKPICKFMVDNKCQFENIECKTWFCPKVKEQGNPKCIKSLEALYVIAKLFELTND